MVELDAAANVTRQVRLGDLNGQTVSALAVGASGDVAIGGAFTGSMTVGDVTAVAGPHDLLIDAGFVAHF